MNITVDAVNDAPTGTGDTKTTNEDTPVSGSVSGADIDGGALTYTKATDPAHGTVTVNSTTGAYTYTPAADYHGADNFDITISDGNGGTTTVTVNITVNAVNDAPTGTGDTKITNEDTPASGSVTGTDIDLDALTYTKATDPAHGSVTVNTDGTYTYTPAANYNGADNFDITISDGNGGTTTVTVNITVNAVNDIPAVTGGTTNTTNEDVAVSGSITATDVEGNALTYTKDTDPAHGSVTVNADGTYTYTPVANYNGPDSFDVTISDGNGGTTTVTVNITVDAVNDAPTGTGDTKTTNEDTPVSSSVSGADIDGGALTYTKATDPGHGTVTVNSTTGAYTYTPAADYHGADNFDITISDGNGGTTTVTVNITVNAVNDAPTGTGDTKVTNEDTPVSGSVTGTDIDLDALTYTKATDPGHGSVTVNADGTYTYMPATNYNGSDNFDITISDGNGGTTTVTVNITVNAVNDVPVNTGSTAQTTNEDTPLNGTITGTDVDGDPLTFTKGTDPAHGTVVVNPDGTYIYTPVPGYNGPDSFTVDINDGNGGTTTVTVNITVTAVNDAPTGTGDTKTTNEDVAVSGAVTGTDPDGDALTYTKATDPAHGTVTVNSANGNYTYTPNANYNGSDNFDITIGDGNGGTATVTVNITVTAVNDVPMGAGDTQTAQEGAPARGAATGMDVDGDPLTFTKGTDPAHGTVVVNADGTYTYTPAAGYTGPDSFTININDGHGGITTVTVNITVNMANNPAISLVKTGVVRADSISITYTFTITNTGNVTLHSVTVTDLMIGLNKTYTGNFLPGDVITETAVYTLTQADRDNGSVSNSAAVSAQTPVNTTISDVSGTAGGNDMPTVTTVSHSPVAVDDDASTRVNTPVNIPVLDNDDARPCCV